jgi:molecular chaperone IbpA
MTTYDLTPLFRSSVGFDRMSRLLDAALKIDGSAPSYPPYNIVQEAEDRYGITLAVAGFGEEDLDVISEDNVLTIKGRTTGDSGDLRYLHRGIAGRAFERRFQLADHIRVTAASMDRGLLHVSLVREIPEALKPRKIEISRAAEADGQPPLVDAKSAS